MRNRRDGVVHQPGDQVCQVAGQPPAGEKCARQAVHNEARKGVGIPESGQSGQRATLGGRVAAASQTLKVFAVEVTQEADTEAGSRTAVVRMPP